LQLQLYSKMKGRHSLQLPFGKIRKSTPWSCELRGEKERVQSPRADPRMRQTLVYSIVKYIKSLKRKENGHSKSETKFCLKDKPEERAKFKLVRKKKLFYSLLPNLFAIMGRTSSASTRVSKKGSNEISAQSDGSVNQLLIGIPLFTCSLKT